MNRIKNLLGVFAFSLLVLSLPLVASAQWGGNNRDRDRDRDDDNYGRGGYNSNYQLRNTIRRLKNDSKDFARFLDRELDRSRLDDSDFEDRLNDLAKDFKNAADRLESKFNERDLNRSSREVQNVINLANRLNSAMRRLRLSRDIEGYWNNIQRQVNEISNAYRYGNNNGRGNNRNNNKFPFPF